MKLLKENALSSRGAKLRRSATLSLVLAGLLVAGLSGGSLTQALAAEGANGDASNASGTLVALPDTNTTPKDEVVYATLSAKGAVDNVYVVNVLTPGSPAVVYDFGSYSAAKNLTDATGIKKEGDFVSLKVANESISYQGDLGKYDLPWDIAVLYELDGKRVEPADLGGKSGNLAITITTTKNPTVNPAFFDNYLLQITVPFASDKTTNVATEEGQIALAGSNTQVTFTGMPEKNGTFKATADVTDFELGGISFAAVPFSMGIESPNTEGLVSGFRQLGEGVGELKGGVEGLATGAGSLATGADQTASGLGSLAGGADGVAGGASDLAGGAGQVATGAQGIEQGVGGLAHGLAAYQAGLAAQAEASRAQVSDTAALQSAYEAATQAYVGAFAGAYSMALQQPGATPEAAAAAAAAATAAESAAMQAALASFVTATGENAGLVGAASALDGAAAGVGSVDNAESLLGGATGLLAGTKQLISGVQGLSSGAHELASGANTLASGANQAATGAGQLASGANQLSSGASQLAAGTSTLHTEMQAIPDKVQQEIDDMMASYDKSDFKPISFVSAKNTSVNLVQFVFSTAPIEPPASTPETAPEQEKGLWDKLLALFGAGA